MTARRAAFLFQGAVWVVLLFTVIVAVQSPQVDPARQPHHRLFHRPATPREALLHDLELAQARDLAGVESRSIVPPPAVHVPSRVR